MRIARLRWLTPQVHAISIPVSTCHARRARRLASWLLFGTILPPETRLTAYSLIRSLFRTFLCGLLVPLVPSLLLRIAYLSHIQSPSPGLGQAPNQRSLFPPVPLACLPPQALRSLRFPSARSHSFGNRRPQPYYIARSRILGTQPWFYHLYLSFCILELTRRLSVFVSAPFQARTSSRPDRYLRSR